MGLLPVVYVRTALNDDVAAEGLEHHARSSVANTESEVALMPALRSGFFQSDGKVAVYAATERFQADTRARVRRYSKGQSAGVCLEAVVAHRVYGA